MFPLWTVIKYHIIGTWALTSQPGIREPLHTMGSASHVTIPEANPKPLCNLAKFL